MHDARSSAGIRMKITTSPHQDLDDQLTAHLENCRLCPRRCGVNRLAGQTGRCGAGDRLIVHHSGPHHGEEPPISGYRGSGAVFFSGCPLHCIYCQNHLWSHARPLPGRELSPRELADLFLRLQHQGCHNINLVTPEPWIPQLIQAICLARKAGLTIPFVYNTSGFITSESLSIIAGIVDIYVTDIRYANPQQAEQFSGLAAYYHVCREAAKQIFHTIGPLETDPSGLAVRGLMVRVLLLPGLPDATEDCLRFIAHELSPDVPVALLSQFEPLHEARQHPLLGRRLEHKSYKEAIRKARELGLQRGWRQDLAPPPPGLLGTSMRKD